MLGIIQHNRRSYLINSPNCILKFTKKNPMVKKVTFADERGFNLTSMKKLDNGMDELNLKNIYQLEFASMNQNLEHLCQHINDVRSENCNTQKWFMKFSDPSKDLYNVEKRLMTHNVALDSIRLSVRSDLENRWQLSGTIKVKNISFEKSVFIRVTFNNWKTFKDYKALYCFTSMFSYILCSSENCDIFWFQLLLPQIIKNENLSVEFCILFKCKDFEYWDNNNGTNYCLAENYS